MNQKQITHTDGTWWTSTEEYNGFEILIKTRQYHGAKVHIKKEGLKTKTFRYTFAPPKFLLDKAKSWIDNLK